MDIRNRMPDVVKLRCNACQDFLKMIIKDGWQDKLYERAEREENGGKYKALYTATYKTMRGLRSNKEYHIEDMDITIMTQVLLYNKNMVSNLHDNTREAIKQLGVDRNTTNHSSENEEKDELYLRALLSLCDLKSFVISVDENEKYIDDNTRRQFRSEYIAKIESLKELIDEERIELIKVTREIDSYISTIKKSEDPEREWVKIIKLYIDNASIKGSFDDYHQFAVRASNEGVIFAHSLAADYYYSIGDYAEWERRLQLLYNSSPKIFMSDVHSIITQIAQCQIQGNKLPDSICELVEKLREEGLPIGKDESGLYFMRKKEHNNSLEDIRKEIKESIKSFCSEE